MFCSSIGSLIAFNRAHRIIDFWTVIAVTKTNSLPGSAGKYSVRIADTSQHGSVTASVKRNITAGPYNTERELSKN